MNRILYEKEQLQNLRKSFNSGMALIQFTVNMPGPDKKAYPSSELFWLGVRNLVSYLCQQNVKIKDVLFKNGSLGITAFFKIDEDARFLKQICIKLEQDSMLGKYWDMDVFDKAGDKVSRRMLQMPSRKCFICDRTAKECAFLQTHTIEELLERMAMDLNEFLKLSEGV